MFLLVTMVMVPLSHCASVFFPIAIFLVFFLTTMFLVFFRLWCFCFSFGCHGFMFVLVVVVLLFFFWCSFSSSWFWSCIFHNCHGFGVFFNCYDLVFIWIDVFLCFS
jgi:hypothetical protein